MTARRIPRPIKRAPERDFKKLEKAVLAFNFTARKEVKTAKRIFTRVPFTLNTKPRKRNVNAGFAADGDTNCGNKAIKNNATLGFRTFTKTACLKIDVAWSFR